MKDYLCIGSLWKFLACMASLRSHNILGVGTVTEPNLNIRKQEKMGEIKGKRKEGKRGRNKEGGRGRRGREEGW